MNLNKIHTKNDDNNCQFFFLMSNEYSLIDVLIKMCTLKIK